MWIHWLRSLRYVDPDGRFLMDVHRRITENALNSSRKGNWKNVSKGVFAFRSAIVGYYAYEMSYKSGSVVAPDLRTLPKILGGKGMESNSREHFDNMNFSQINENFSYIGKNIDKAIGSYNSGAIDSFELGQVVGEYYHAIQDFYSHSNYVELYEKTYGQTNVKNIPTYADAMSNKKYARFAALLKAELKTGEYPGKGPGSHRQMNHDLGAGASNETSLAPEVLGKKVNWNSRAAEDVATRATRNTNTYVESKIK